MMEVLQTLAELAEIASLWLSVSKSNIDLPRSIVIEQVNDQLSEPQKLLLADPENQRIIEALIIDQGLLDTIERQIDQVSQDYQRGLSSQSPQAREAADRVADRQICEWLNRVRDKNGGDLPTDKLRRFWASHGCIRF